MRKKLLHLAMAMAIVVSLAFNATLPASTAAAAPADPAPNLALHKPAYSSGAEADSVSDDKAVDGSTGTRWSSNYLVQDPSPDDAWWYVDLETSQPINKVVLTWAHPPAQKYQLLVSNDAVQWTNAQGDGVIIDGTPEQDILTFSTVNARYVKFQGIERTANEHGVYFGYAIAEFEVMYEPGAPQPNANLALHQPAFSSGAEEASVSDDKAVDGSQDSRWSSNYLSPNPPPDQAWWYVDLGSAKSIQSIVIRWGDAYAQSYQLLVSNDLVTWTNAVGSDAILTGRDGKQTITFDPITARYVKFQGIERAYLNNVKFGYAISEFEVYSQPLSDGIVQEIAAGITQLPPIAPGAGQLSYPEVPPGYTISLFGSDRKQVIGLDGSIHTPLVDAAVQLLFQVEDASNPDANAITGNLAVTVPGQYTQTAELNKEPRVIPSLREWLGRTGSFSLSPASRIVVATADQSELQQAAEALQADYKELGGLDLPIVTGSPQPGDIYLALDAALGQLGHEGYVLDVDHYAAIQSSDPTGVFYGTRSILQILKQEAEHRLIPRGIAHDYPKYEIRGMMLDVARKFYTIDFLRDYVKLMGWYKMNTFQIHLNDSIGVQGMPFTDGTYAAFRLESETYPGLTSQSGSYSKAEFRDLQLLGNAYGVNIIPEIDTPGHSQAFIDYMPSLGSGNHMFINEPQTVQFVKSLFDEYIDGPNPTFLGPDVHIGTDEYHAPTQADKEDFRAYMNTLIGYINDKGKHPHFWGGLEHYSGVTPVRTDVTMDVWHEAEQGPIHAIENGFNIVNVQDAFLYIVPIYRDYLDIAYLYNEWEPNQWANNTIPLGHPNLLGGKYALWNDISEDSWITMDDSFARIYPALQVLSEKLWTGTRQDKNYGEYVKAAAAIGQAPQTNLAHAAATVNTDGRVMEFMYENGLLDASSNGYHGTGTNVTAEAGKFGQGLRFNGGQSYQGLPLQSLGFGWTVSMWIKPDANNPDDAIILESPQGVLKLKQGTTGKLGLSKDRYNSTFNYSVPSGVWTHLMLTGDQDTTTLYVNGNEYEETLPYFPVQSFVLPTRTLGSKTNAFRGVLDNVMFYNQKFNQSQHNNYALLKPVDSSGAEIPSVSADKAVDGNISSRWSSDYFLPDPDHAWLSVDLEAPTEFNQITIRWGDAFAQKYQLLISEDNVVWHNVLAEGTELTGENGTSVVEFPNVTARYVKFQGLQRTPINGNLFGYVIHELGVFKSDGASIADKIARYRVLAEEAASLLALNQGNQTIRSNLNVRLKNYPFDFTRPFADLELLIDELEASINSGGNPNPGVPNPPVGNPQDEEGTNEGETQEEEAQEEEPQEGTDDGGKQPEQEPPAGSVDEGHFTDTAGHWAEAAIERAAAAGIITGYTDGSFRPERAVTRAEFIVMLARALAWEGAGAPASFADSSSIGSWALQAVRQAVQAGIITGYEDGTFRPHANMSREASATVIARALKLAVAEASDVQDLQDLQSAPDVQGVRSAPDVPAFADASAIQPWAADAVLALQSAGLVQGRGGNRFVPQGTLSRAEAVTILLRVIDRDNS